MNLLADPVTLAVLVAAVVLLGMAKGGLAGVGALATPLAALVLPPATAAALLLPILIVQDVISVWSFRKTGDGWIIGWMLPGAALGSLAGYVYAERVNEAQLMAALGAITLAFGVYRLWVERGGRIVAASQSPGWVGSLFGGAFGFDFQPALIAIGAALDICAGKNCQPGGSKSAIEHQRVHSVRLLSRSTTLSILLSMRSRVWDCVMTICSRRIILPSLVAATAYMFSRYSSLCSVFDEKLAPHQIAVALCVRRIAINKSGMRLSMLQC